VQPVKNLGSDSNPAPEQRGLTEMPCLIDDALADVDDGALADVEKLNEKVSASC
jgi:hypothetical protein